MTLNIGGGFGLPFFGPRGLSVVYFSLLPPPSRRPAQVPVEAIYSLASDDAEDPVKDMEQQEEVQRLHQALLQLTEAQRQVLSLRFGGELSSEEIARVMGKKSGAVREMQSAAIRRLRQIMGEEI